MRLNITSAAGILALLDEPEPEIKLFALQKLNKVVDMFWPEVSESVDKIEMLYEDESFKHRELSALVASKVVCDHDVSGLPSIFPSKIFPNHFANGLGCRMVIGNRPEDVPGAVVYYHLGAFEVSLTFALGAGSLFDVNSTSEYVETTIAKCIDHYTKLRVQNSEGGQDDHKEIDPRLEGIVNRMFKRCFDDHKYKQAVGIALETRRIDVFEDAIMKSDDVPGMLSYTLKVCMSLIQNRQFRNTILRKLVKLYMGLATPDYINVCQCFIFLDDPQAVADILEKLIKDDGDAVLMAYQIGFDLYESATQQFLGRVQAALRATAPIPIPAAGSAGGAAPSVSTASTEGGSTMMETDQNPEEAASTPAPSASEEGSTPAGSSTTTTTATAATTTPAAVAPKLEELSEQEKELQDRVTKLHAILGGETTIGIQLQFLIRNNKTDLLILRNTKDAVRNSVCHTSTVIANALMNSGTTSDQFLRDNLEWLARATNWAKFTATASLGVIHKGHEKEALNLMATYLPKDSGPGSAYSEGGGLYALGLIHANHGGEISEYLLNQLKSASTDMVRHGACLGLGLAAMGTARQDVYDQLKFNLYQDDAVTGEAAGIAMGLVMLGTKSATAIEDMVAYAQDTQHEKILRGLGVGIALTMYGRLEEADALIESLSRDKDPILRWSGMYTLAMAYCGTGNNTAIRRLLHVAVSDVNNDVRRVAVSALGFLLFRTPEQCPSVVSLLSESYNPHVRYGAALALGIACSGTGLKEALALLEPMTNDPVNYVRQGALIASAMILIQQNEVTCPKVLTYRQLYTKVIGDKHEDVMAKFGAIIAQGIIDAGGRNVTISLQSRTGHTNMAAVVGMVVFCQFWFWYPLTHFLSLAFVPTALVGLTSTLQMPKMEFKSNAKPSTFAYPPPLEDKKKENKEKVETAVLSITAKAKKKEADKEKKEKADEKMEVDEEKKDSEKDGAAAAAATSTTTTAATTKDKEEPMEQETAKDEKEEKEKDEKEEKKEEKKPEPLFEMLSNPARVMKSQLKVVSLPEGSRYTPLKEPSIGGIIMVRDSRPDEKQEIIEPVAAGGPKMEEEEEPEPPEPFEWTED